MWEAMGAPPVAESSDLSEWQRSAGNEGLCRGACRVPQQGIGPYRKTPRKKVLEMYIFYWKMP